MTSVSEVLRERLGPRGAADLEEYAEDLGERWRNDVLQTRSERSDNRLALATQSFENRLTQEIGSAGGGRRPAVLHAE